MIAPYPPPLYNCLLLLVSAVCLLCGSPGTATAGQATAATAVMSNSSSTRSNRRRRRSSSRRNRRSSRNRRRITGCDFESH